MRSTHGEYARKSCLAAFSDPTLEMTNMGAVELIRWSFIITRSLGCKVVFP